jgi:hypothetical protein
MRVAADIVGEQAPTIGPDGEPIIHPLTPVVNKKRIARA